MSDHLRQFVERIERLEGEIAELNADKSEVYKEAKGSGFDVKALRKLISIRRQPVHEREELDAVLTTYMVALGMAPDPSLVRAHVRARTEPQHTIGQEALLHGQPPAVGDRNQGDAAPSATAPAGRQTEGASLSGPLQTAVSSTSEAPQAATPIRRDEEPEMPAFLRRTRPVASEITA